jgi:copper(I)-binding protein
MIRLPAWTILLLAGLGACQPHVEPPVVISDVRILAPIPGSSTGVAYMTISNHGNAPIRISGIRSPQFERIEMHETRIDAEGLSRMNQLGHVEIPADGTTEFIAGGKHLMLMGAKPDAKAESPVTLEIEYNEGLLVVSAPLQRRRSTE